MLESLKPSERTAFGKFKLNASPPLPADVAVSNKSFPLVVDELLFLSSAHVQHTYDFCEPRHLISYQLSLLFILTRGSFPID